MYSYLRRGSRSLWAVMRSSPGIPASEPSWGASGERAAPVPLPAPGLQNMSLAKEEVIVSLDRLHNR